MKKFIIVAFGLTFLLGYILAGIGQGPGSIFRGLGVAFALTLIGSFVAHGKGIRWGAITIAVLVFLMLLGHAA